MSRPLLVVFVTLGCKVNRYDSAALRAMLPESGFRSMEVNGIGKAVPIADFYVINTCAVTGESALQSKQMVRRARRHNPAGKVIAAGCLGECEADALLEAGADFVVGVQNRGRELEALGLARPSPSPVFFHSGGGLQSRGRAVVKVQDGCDYQCSYCLVRIVRGRSRSLEIDDALSQLRSLHDRGFKEAVLTGVHLGLYGLDRGQRLIDLVMAIASAEGLPARVRLSSLEPHEVSEELLEAMRNSARFCPHFHLPLQSGSARVLKAMRRPYTPSSFGRAVEIIKNAMPSAGIGVDIIAGFPGETAEDHGQTMALLDSLPISYFHVFPFSSRPGTEAHGLGGKLDRAEIKTRAAELRRLGVAKKSAFLAGLIGSEVELLVEKVGDGVSIGTSGNYARVEVAGELDEGNLARAVVDKAYPDRVTARAVDPSA